MKDKNSILLTIDVEDWFQVENFKPWIPFSSWSIRELRVEKNTHRLLDLFDTFVSTRNPITATFFILGWIAERLPNLVREIHNRGHEVASHGYNHELPNVMTNNELEKDLINSKKLLEDTIGSPVVGYRAPSFAINNDGLKIIEECGYLYDSSYNSFGMHGRYGQLLLNGNGKKGIAHKISENFFELPISNLKMKNHIFPLGGGGYFRIIPFHLFKLGIYSILGVDDAFLLYIHPWEIDPEQPRVDDASAFLKFRHYTNLRKTFPKISNLIKEYSNCRFVSCQKYLSKLQ